MRALPLLSLPFLGLMVLGCSANNDTDKDANQHTGVVDSGKPDTDTDTDTDTDEPTPLALSIDDVPTDPVEHGSLTHLIGHVTGWTPQTELIWLSETEGELSRPIPDADGTVVLDLTALEPAWHFLTLKATRGEEVADYSISLGLCEDPPIETFSTSPDPSLWSLYGNAHWDANGWIEITGNATGSAGQIFKTDRAIDPGNFTVDFDIATGSRVPADLPSIKDSTLSSTPGTIREIRSWTPPRPTTLEFCLTATPPLIIFGLRCPLSKI
jgi:hypothetical protein